MPQKPDNPAPDIPARPASLTAQEGSTLYYSLLPLTPALRTTALKSLRLSQQLADALLEVQEPKVADQKIHWWHEEIERLCTAQSRHPDCKALQPVIERLSETQRSQCQQLLLDILSANSAEKYCNHADSQAFTQRILLDYQARLSLTRLCLEMQPVTETKLPHGTQPPTANDNLQHQQRDYAIGLGLFDRLRSCHKLRHRSYEVWPDELYKSHNLSPAELGLASKKDQSHALFAAVIDASIVALENALHNNDAGHSSPAILSTDLPCKANSTSYALPLHISASLRLAQLKLWRKRKADPMHHYIALTPLRKAWLSMRCRRQYQRKTEF